METAQAKAGESLKPLQDGFQSEFVLARGIGRVDGKKFTGQAVAWSATAPGFCRDAGIHDDVWLNFGA
jgi:hypothetical protein